MSLVNGIHHVCMKCSSLEKYKEAIYFYEELLGMRMVRQWDKGILFDSGSGYIEIFNNAEDTLSQGTIRHFALGTDCVDELTKTIEKAGYEITKPVHDVTIPSVPPFPIRIAFCIGPVGEEIELFQEK